MEFITGCAIYIAVCEGICYLLGFEGFSKKALVYAIVSALGGFLIKTMMQ